MQKPIEQAKRTGAIWGVAVAFVVALILAEVLGLAGIVLGALVMLVALLAGLRAGRSWACPQCRNPLASAEVRMCPTCGAGLE